MTNSPALKTVPLTFESVAQVLPGLPTAEALPVAVETAPQKTLRAKASDAWQRIKTSEAGETAKLWLTTVVPPGLITAAGFVAVGLDYYGGSSGMHLRVDNGGIGALFAGAVATGAMVFSNLVVKPLYAKAGEKHPSDNAMGGMLKFVALPFTAVEAAGSLANWQALGGSADTNINIFLAASAVAVAGAGAAYSAAAVRLRRAPKVETPALPAPDAL